MYGLKSKERRDLFRCLWSEWRHAGSVPDMMVHQSSVLCSWLLIFIQPWGLWAEMCMLLGQICLFTFFSSMHEGCTPFRLSPCGFIFTCWGCCGLCQRHKPTDLAHSFWFCSCAYFCLCGPFNCILFHKILPTILCLHSLFFPSYFLSIGPFNYISLYESLRSPF